VNLPDLCLSGRIGAEVAFSFCFQHNPIKPVRIVAFGPDGAAFCSLKASMLMSFFALKGVAGQVFPQGPNGAGDFMGVGNGLPERIDDKVAVFFV